MMSVECAILVIILILLDLALDQLENVLALILHLHGTIHQQRPWVGGNLIVDRQNIFDVLKLEITWVFLGHHGIGCRAETLNGAWEGCHNLAY